MPNSTKKPVKSDLSAEKQQEALILAQQDTEGSVDDYMDGLRIINLTSNGKQHGMLQDIMAAIATTLSVDEPKIPPNAYSVEQLQARLEQYINSITDEDAYAILVEDYKVYLETELAGLQLQLNNPAFVAFKEENSQKIKDINDTIDRIHMLFDVKTAKQDLIENTKKLTINLIALAKSLNRTIVILSQQTSDSIPQIELICNAEAGGMPIFVDYAKNSMSRVHHRPLFVKPDYDPKEILENLKKLQLQDKEMQAQEELAYKSQQEKLRRDQQEKIQAFWEASIARTEEFSRKLQKAEARSQQLELSIQAKTAAIFRHFAEREEQAIKFASSIHIDLASVTIQEMMQIIGEQREQALRSLQEEAKPEERFAIERILEEHRDASKGIKGNPRDKKHGNDQKYHDSASKTKNPHSPYLQIKNMGSFANPALPYSKISDPDIKKIAKYVTIKPTAGSQKIIGEIKNIVPLPTVVPDTKIAPDSVLASITADSITCPIIGATSGRLSIIQQQIFVDFLESQAAASIEYQPTVIEANDFDPEDLRSIIKLLSKKNPKPFIKLQLPSLKDTKDANGIGYQQHVYDDLKYDIDRYSEQSKMVKIFERTKEIAVEMERHGLLPEDSILYNHNNLRSPNAEDRGNVQNTLNFRLVEKDALSAAKDLLHESTSAPLIMNMANSYAIGGGVEVGSISQEESILRCSNYHVSLYKNGVPISGNSTRLRYNIATENGNALKSIPHDAAYYTSNITVFRDGKTYEELPSEDHFNIDAVAIAGYNLGGYSVEGSSPVTHTEDDKELLEAFKQDIQDKNTNYDNLKKLFIEKTTTKIMLMLQIAYTTKAENLILGAISCGAFRLNISGLSDDWTAEAVKQAYINAFAQAKVDGLLSHVKNIAFAVMPSAVQDIASDINIKIFGKLAKELQNTINPSAERIVRFKR